MKLRTRITILFTLITATILLIFAAIVYFSSKESREREFFDLLKNEAITKANLFFDAKVDTLTLQDIYRRNREVINEVEVAIYDKDFNLLYHDAVDIDFVQETPEMINEIIENGEVRFVQKDWQVVGIRYPYKGKDYAITAAAYDGYGYNKLYNLRQTILIVFLTSILVLYLLGIYFSRRAFKPIKGIVQKAQIITATNLDLRLKTSNKKDEISELSNTFNKMLDRLESSFDSQKEFVFNISHELRTPLAAIIAELELASESDKTKEEYKDAIQNSLNDAKRLVRLSNSLLDLAKASYDASEIKFKQLRVDEVLLDARQQVLKANPEYKIDIVFKTIEEEKELLLNGNEYLLKVAFANLFDNVCKKKKKCTVSISIDNNKITLNFTDEGTGISEEELQSIFIPFYRGENSKLSNGSGIGLPLTKKIIELHKGTISVTSKVNAGSEFMLSFDVM